jgi:hypothetical protein
MGDPQLATDRYLHMHVLRKPMLALHIASAVGAFGGELVLLALGVAGLSGAAPAAIFPAAHIAAAYVIRPLAVLTMATGILAALASPYGLFRHWWTLIKLALVVVLTALVLFNLVPSLDETAQLASAGGTAAEFARQRTSLVTAPLIGSSLLFIAILLGVFKPFGRIGQQTLPVHRTSPRI